RVEPIGALHPCEPVVHARVVIHRPFRSSRRARRIDDVGEMSRNKADRARLRVASGLVTQFAPVAIQDEPRRRSGGESPYDTALRKYDTGGRVFQHVPHTLGWV